MDEATCSIMLSLFKYVNIVTFILFLKQVRRPELKIALREDVVAAPAPGAATQAQQTHTRAAAAASSPAAAAAAAAAPAPAQGSSFADEPSTPSWYQ